MHCYSVSGFQLGKLVSTVNILSVIHLYRHSTAFGVNGSNNTHIPVIGTHTGFGTVPLIGNVIIVFDLHYLVATAQHTAALLPNDLRLIRCRRVQNACRRRFSSTLPVGPTLVGQSTWMSRTGS